ncbi:hypothetical protein HGRIS_009095 [Hohenbuehelia grisea]|uniref:Uncharacterized protein n=1 Tax=Hohenbuehelia grisea TaxID=104357 RepID=A0ABR3J0B1_9AGAR
MICAITLVYSRVQPALFCLLNSFVALGMLASQHSPLVLYGIDSWMIPTDPALNIGCEHRKWYMLLGIAAQRDDQLPAMSSVSQDAGPVWAAPSSLVTVPFLEHIVLFLQRRCSSDNNRQQCICINFGTGGPDIRSNPARINRTAVL